MRPANIVTAFADILAGFAAAGGMIRLDQILATPVGLGWLLLSTLGLYGGGVVFNDVFDAPIDAQERPERAIPSEKISIKRAALLGTILLVMGIFGAFIVSTVSGGLAIGIAACAIFYNEKAKQSAVWGPLFMGVCRGGNLLLGCSINLAAVAQLWFLALIPIAYIAAITLVSRGEVHGGDKKSGFIALGMIVLILISELLLALLPHYQLIKAIPVIILFAIAVLPPFGKAAFNPSPEYIKKAIQRGVLSLILLNSAIAAGFAGFFTGALTLILLPASILLAKVFAVT